MANLSNNNRTFHCRFLNGSDMTGNGTQEYYLDVCVPADLKGVKSKGKEKCYCSSPGLRVTKGTVYHEITE